MTKKSTETGEEKPEGESLGDERKSHTPPFLLMSEIKCQEALL